MKRLLPRITALALAGAALQAQAAGPTFWFADTPYLSAADIPAGFYGAGGPTLLDTLEDGSLDATLSGSGGSLIGPGAFDGGRDSVDDDDGALDGICSPQSSFCRSWFNGAGSSGVSFTFQGGGALPTAFGLVWTDGGGDITFTAFDADGQSLGSITRGGFADGSFFGTTGEDRFFGVTFDGGVKSIFISNSSGGIEVDHLQYGNMAPVPEPGAWALMLGGLAGLGLRRRIARR